jgi:hypothetical protein
VNPPPTGIKKISFLEINQYFLNRMYFFSLFGSPTKGQSRPVVGVIQEMHLYISIEKYHLLEIIKPVFQLLEQCGSAAEQQLNQCCIRGLFEFQSIGCDNEPVRMISRHV